MDFMIKPFRFGGILPFALLLVAMPAAARSQQPTTQQVEKILQSRPELAGKVRAKIATSGLTPEQIRARLQAAGYPPSLLDQYMGAETPNAVAPGDDVLKAVRFLGLVDSLDVELSRQNAAAEVPIHQELEARTGSDSGLRIFGLDVFRRAGATQFQPDIAGPVNSDYRVGPRDVLALIITGGVENSYTLEVTREGFIIVPQVGQIYVANLTIGQIEEVLLRRLRAVYSGIGRNADASTHFYVTLAKLRVNQVFVIGEVMSPGSYQVSSVGTVLTALYAAGGPTDNGSLRRVEVRRGGRLINTFDAYDYLVRGDASHDVQLQNGDVVFVGVHGPFASIYGEVIHPAVFELKNGETIADLIAMAGGFNAQADRRRILVRRVLPPSERTRAGYDRVVIDIASNQMDGKGPAFKLERGDQVEVFSIADRVRNEVSVQGNVWAPGVFALAPDMKLSEALRRAGGVRPDAKDVLISRLQTDQTRRELRTSFRDTLGTPVEDIRLQEDDKIRVFGLAEFRPERYVAITGAIRDGGRFPYHEGMTLRDLVHLARGLAEGAFLNRAEIARLPADRSQGAMATQITVPLDSTYVLERGLDGKYHGPPGIQVTGSAPDVVLQPYDNVLILRQPEWELQRVVTIAGEVKFPGNYTLLSKDERLVDLVKRAGGLTRGAYAGGVVFHRSEDRVGRIGVDLERALKDPAARDNMLLAAGDSVFVPEYRAFVRVEGSVNSPLAVAYIPGRDLRYYVDAAGGATYNADLDRAYVRQPNGEVETYNERFLLPDASPRPRPGSVVVVPAQDPSKKADWTVFAGTLAQVVASLATIIIVARR